MKTVMIGYKISIGIMKGKNGEDVNYNSRTVRFITDMGANSENVGFEPFEAKFKLDDLARVLGVNPDNIQVNEALNRCINKSVVCTFAPVFGELKCVAFSLEK